MLSEATIRLLHDEESTGDECRMALVADYYAATGADIDGNALDNDQRNAMVHWLRENKLSEALVHKRSILSQHFFDSLETKLSWHTQRPCGSCRTEFPVRIVPVLHPALSFQAVDASTTKAFRAAFKDRYGNVFGDPVVGPVCVRIVVVLAERRRDRIDVDNLAKTVLDAAKGTFFGDDSAVEHLEVLKFRSLGDLDYFYLRVAPTQVSSVSDVLRPWHAGQFLVDPIDLQPYLEAEAGRE